MFTSDTDGMTVVLITVHAHGNTQGAKWLISVPVVMTDV